ncbi:MAG: DUF3108 domain-containing protein [Candidatus Kryptoniota bacterium]
MNLRLSKTLIKAVTRFSIVVIGSAIVLTIVATVYAIAGFNQFENYMISSGWRKADESLMMNPGEELTYEVSYLFLKIGAVKFKFLGEGQYDGRDVYRMAAYINSYNVPFVNMHAIFETTVDKDNFKCYYTRGLQKESYGWSFVTQKFNYRSGRIIYEQGINDSITKQIYFPLDKNYTDGVGFIYYLRKLFSLSNGGRFSYDVPIMVDTTRSDIKFTLNKKREACEIDAYGYPIDSYYLDGRIGFQGFFGVTGYFEGWIANDPASIPIKGKVKVLLGSVLIQLKAQNRSRWTPPRSAE